MPGNRLCPRAECNDTLEILRLIFVIGNGASVAVKFVSAWTPPRSIPLRDYTMNPVWREEAVLNALAKAIFVKRIAKILIGIAIVVAQRCRGHSQLIGRLEVAQNRSP
jgi:hypothetical protein